MTTAKSPTPAQRAPHPASPVQPVRTLSAEERSADIRAFGREIRRSKAQALAFLQRAGILDERGKLIDPLRA